MVNGTATVHEAIFDESGEWGEIPIFEVAGSNGINMGVKCEDFFAGADSGDDVTERVNKDFVEAGLEEFIFNFEADIFFASAE